MPGIIALDIDGTITAEHHTTPPIVGEYFTHLAAKGWSFIFITGRTFQWGYKALQNFPFPYYFAVNNGALLFEMPSRRIVKRKYLTRDHLLRLEVVRQDFVIFGGYESEDRCYFRPSKFQKELLKYLESRFHDLEENWISIETFENLPLHEFAAFKFFAKDETSQKLSEILETGLNLHAPVIRDPYDPAYHVIQATHPHVSKGETVEDFKQLTGKKFVIAAGDDKNDYSMLQKASLKIVMATAPGDMLAFADIVAPPAREFGIIDGLKEAIKQYDNHWF